MIRYVAAIAMAGAAAMPAIAHAQAADTPANAPSAVSEQNRFAFEQTEDGYLRLDHKTGQVSQCSRREIGWSCVAVPDDRSAYDAEIARLQVENAALKKALADRAAPRPGDAVPTPPPPATGSGEGGLRLPSDADVDRAMTALEKMWRRMLEMMLSVQRDLKNRT